MTDFDSAPERYRQDVSMQYGDRIQFYTQAAWLREHSKNNPIPSNYTTVSVALHNVAQLANLDSSREKPLASVDHKYPPCTTEIGSLKPIAIKDLKVESHHRGSVLVARRIGGVSQTWVRLLASVQDQAGNACALTFWHHMRDVPAEEFLPKNCVLAIKEPYLSIEFRSFHPRADLPVESLLVVRVDHPADLVVLPASSSLMPTAFRTSSAAQTAMACKEQGNAAFASKRFLAAQRCYTEGLRIAAGDAGDKAITSDLLRNRAQVNLALSFFDNAMTDALASMEALPSTDDRSRSLNNTALFRAATAAYRLGQFDKSHSLLEDLLKLTPDDKQANILQKKTRLRLKQQQGGKYAFAKIREHLDPSGTTDAASYAAKTRTGSTPGFSHDIGLFASEDIKAGDLVICEKAFAVSSPQDKAADFIVGETLADGRTTPGIHGAYDFARWKNVVDLALRNESALAEILRLRGGQYKSSGQGKCNDVFFIESIAGFNAIAVQDSGLLMSRRNGLWLHAALMNHSCVPNTARGCVGDLLVVHATRDIKAGEQIFANYAGIDHEFVGVRHLLQTSHGVHCNCALCIAEQATTPAQRAVRQELVKPAAVFIEEVQMLPRDTKKARIDSLIKRGTNLIKRLSATYDDDTFVDGVPRRGLAGLHLEMCNLYQEKCQNSSRRVELGLQNAIQALTALGYSTTINGLGDVTFVNVHGIELPTVEEILKACSQATAFRGHFATARRFIELSKEIHRQENGDLAKYPDMLSNYLSSLPAEMPLLPNNPGIALPTGGLTVVTSYKPA